MKVDFAQVLIAGNDLVQALRRTETGSDVGIRLKSELSV
jgi:hypothetical protein